MENSQQASATERPILIQGKHVGLTMMRKEDIPTIARWHQNLEFTAFMGAPGEVHTLEMRQEAYDRNARMKSDSIEFGFVVPSTGALAGFGGLFDITRSMTATIFVGIDPAFWNRGLGTDAVRLLCDYGFFFRSFHNIRLQTNGFNRRAIRTYEKVGFRLVGRVRGAVVLDGKRYDEVIMDHVRDDYVPHYVGRFADKLRVEAS